jgi:hypothetical protein
MPAIEQAAERVELSWHRGRSVQRARCRFPWIENARQPGEAMLDQDDHAQALA